MWYKDEAGFSTKASLLARAIQKGYHPSATTVAGEGSMNRKLLHGKAAVRWAASMRRLVLAFLLCLAGSARASVADERWPRRVGIFSAKRPATLSHAGFRVTINTPADPQIRAGGGSGGPMLAFRVRNRRTGQAVTFYDQSICTVLLGSWHSHPQLETWGRGGGGSWTRSLYRFVGGEYRAVRYDEFEDHPRHPNEQVPTVRPPFVSPEDDPDAVLYFVGTRLP